MSMSRTGSVDPDLKFDGDDGDVDVSCIASPHRNRRASPFRENCRKIVGFSLRAQLPDLSGSSDLSGVADRSRPMRPRDS